MRRRIQIKSLHICLAPASAIPFGWDDTTTWVRISGPKQMLEIGKMWIWVGICSCSLCFDVDVDVDLNSISLFSKDVFFITGDGNTCCDQYDMSMSRGVCRFSFYRRILSPLFTYFRDRCDVMRERMIYWHDDTNWDSKIYSINSTTRQCFLSVLIWNQKKFYMYYKQLKYVLLIRFCIQCMK